MLVNPATQLVDTTLSSSGNPTVTSQSGTNSIDASYSATPNVGDTYTFATNPSQVSSPGGVVVPQTGTVI
jgi:hypothetical protein